MVVWQFKLLGKGNKKENIIGLNEYQFAVEQMLQIFKDPEKNQQKINKWLKKAETMPQEIRAIRL